MRNKEFINELKEYPNYRIFARVNGELVELEKVKLGMIAEKHHITDRFHSSKPTWQLSEELGSFEAIILYD